MDRKEDILHCAYEIAGTEGLEAVHARTLASTLGINHATVHYYFPRRSDLLLGVADYAFRRLEKDRTRLAEQIAGATSLEAELSLAEAYLRPQSRFYKVWAALFVASQSDQKLRKKLQENTKNWLSVYERSLKNKGRAKPSKDAPFRSPSLLAGSVLGLGLLAHLMGSELETANLHKLMTSSALG